MIVFTTALLLDFSDTFLAASSLVACPIIFFGLQPSIVGYFLRRLNYLERIFLLLSPLSLLVFLYSQNFVWFALGIAIIALFATWQVRIVKKGGNESED